jgi:hypothetical protein
MRTAAWITAPPSCVPDQPLTLLARLSRICAETTRPPRLVSRRSLAAASRLLCHAGAAAPTRTAGSGTAFLRATLLRSQPRLMHGAGHAPAFRARTTAAALLGTAAFAALRFCSLAALLGTRRRWRRRTLPRAGLLAPGFAALRLRHFPAALFRRGRLAFRASTATHA